MPPAGRNSTYPDCPVFPSLLYGSGLCVAHPMLELGEEQLDRVEIGVIRRQEEHMRAGAPGRAACGLASMAADIVEHDDVALCKGRSENLLGVKREEFGVDRAVDDEGRIDPIDPERADEGQRLPVAVGRASLKTLSPQSPAAQRRHVGLDPGFVDEDEAARIDPGLMRLPARFFLKLSPSACRNIHTVRRSLLIPRASNSAAGPRVVNGPERQRSRNQSATSPDRRGFLCPPILPWSSEPVSAFNLRDFETQDGLIFSATPIERMLSPASNRDRARSRRTSE